jgi:hypothetical protein
MPPTFEDLDRRMKEQERIHNRGGPCEEQACRVWGSIERLTERLTAIEVKMYVLFSVIGVVGPLLAQFIGRKIGL